MAIDLVDFRQWIEQKGIEMVFFNEQRWWDPVLLCAELGVIAGAYVDYYTRSTVPLFLVDSQGDIMPAAQLDDLVAHLQSAGVKTYQAMTVTGSGHSFVNWPLVSKDAIAFLAATFGKSR